MCTWILVIPVITTELDVPVSRNILTLKHIVRDSDQNKLYERLKELYGKWVQPKGKTANDIGEVLIYAIFMNAVS